MEQNVKLDLKGRYNNFNRVEVLDKADILNKLESCLNNQTNDNYDFYSFINKEIFITRKSLAKLYLFDNKKKLVYALDLDTYNKLLELLDTALNLYY